MTLPSSGVISLDNLRTEFGVSGAISMLDVYAGTEGAVPPAFGGFNDDIPVSGSGSSIALNDFYGAQNIYEATITSVGVFSGKIEGRQGFSSVGLGGDYGQMFNQSLPNLSSVVKTAANVDFIFDQIDLLVSVANSGYGFQRALAWTTVTFTGNTTEKFSRIAATSTTFNEEDSTAFWRWIRTSISAGGSASPSEFPEPFTPLGGKVTILFENNG